MLGEALALISAGCFGLAGASIAHGMRCRTRSGGDNGALLSVIFSAIVAALLFIGLPKSMPLTDRAEAWAVGVALFVLAGTLSTILGRLTFFRSVALSGATRSSLLRRLIPVFAAIFAWVFLGETLGLGDTAAMALILIGVIYAVTGRAFGQTLGTGSNPVMGLGLGIASSGFYGGSYVARKMGMTYVPDAAFGALVGALTGLAWYAMMALMSGRARLVVRELPRTTDRWHVITASALAAGQTTLFFALTHAEVAIVAVIGSTEVFISAILASLVFRTEPIPSLRLLAGMTLAISGVALLVLR